MPTRKVVDVNVSLSWVEKRGKDKENVVSVKLILAPSLPASLL